MAAYTRWPLIAVCAVFLVLDLHRATASQEIMTKLTKGFAKVMDQCKSELNLGDHIMKDFMNYWREEYDLLNRDLGCAIMCMASKLDLVSDDMKLHHGNAHQFAMSHGADDEMAKQLVTMVHECEKSQEGTNDDCLKALEVAKCFRTKIHQLKWAPSMEVILEEIMTEI